MQFLYPCTEWAMPTETENLKKDVTRPSSGEAEMRVFPFADHFSRSIGIGIETTKIPLVE